MVITNSTVYKAELLVPLLSKASGFGDHSRVACTCSADAQASSTTC